jgi:hypothetical protein
MAEGFELVRMVRQHLRCGATLLQEGKLDEALAEVDAALVLDAQSLPAQALRDRIEKAKQAPSSLHHELPATPAPTTSFVPHGVNAASWRGFEQRIQERRFRALLDTINTSIVAGDAMTARVALEEARELRPDAAELAAFEARVAAVPVALPVAGGLPASRIWMRAMGAAALFLIGVGMLIGLESMRPLQPITPQPLSVPAAPAVAPSKPIVVPTEDLRLAETPDSESLTLAISDEESVPAIVTPPEPSLRPLGTTGMPAPPVTPVSRPVALRDTSPAPLELRDVVEDPPIRPVGEIPDDYVLPPATRTAAATAADLARSPLPPVRMPATTLAADSAPAPAPSASVVAAVALPPAEQGRVEEVLRRYARAYGDLNASAARDVWPTVNEKALAKAFKDLASQNLSFDDCEIDIRGAVANASCRGQYGYVGKVGSREPRTESRTWRFELRRDGEAWKIENAEARRLSTSESYR